MGHNDKATPKVELRDVTADTWRDVARLEVTEAQRAFVAEPCYYLCLCHYGQLWQPLAICNGGKVVGMLMWAVDDADGSIWLGGIMIDHRHQGRGLGRAAVKKAIQTLSRQRGRQQFALSYNAENVSARRLYASMGFIETGETEGDEIVARRSGDLGNR